MNTRKGFTLVELLVVIAILAILATVSVVGYTSFIQNANDSVALSELTQIRDYVIANKYIEDDIDVEGLDTKLGLKGTITTKYTADHKTYYVYTIEDGEAYWNAETNEISTDDITLDGTADHVYNAEGKCACGATKQP